MFRVEAVIFDLDGVLVETEDFNVHAALEGFRAIGHALEPGDERQIVGRHPDDYVPELARRFGIAEADQRRLRAIQDRFYGELWDREGRLKEGAVEALAFLRARGKRLGLATSSSRAEVERCRARFRALDGFEIVLTKDDVARRKPDPEIYLACARHLALQPRAMLVVEDSEYGVRAAKAAGARCVAVLTRHTPPAEIREAEAWIPSLHELPGLVGEVV